MAVSLSLSVYLVIVIFIYSEYQQGTRALEDAEPTKEKKHESEVKKSVSNLGDRLAGIVQDLQQRVMQNERFRDQILRIHEILEENLEPCEQGHPDGIGADEPNENNAFETAITSELSSIKETLASVLANVESLKSSLTKVTQAMILPPNEST